VKFDLRKSIAVLERTPGVVRALLAGLPDEWAQSNEGPETWSPFDVVGHLIDNEETNFMVRAQVILAQGEDRRFPPFDRFRHLRLNRGKTLAELLDRFAELRARNLRTLAGLRLTTRELGLRGEHPDFGTVTLEQLLSTWVVHDLDHIAQIVRVMARQYREAVGPWAAYLRVLR
jgi:hypothetical protein